MPEPGTQGRVGTGNSCIKGRTIIETGLRWKSFFDNTNVNCKIKRFDQQ